MSTLQWVAQGFDPRPLTKSMWQAFVAGWKHSREVRRAHRHLKVRWWRWPLFWSYCYATGASPEHVVMFPKGDFTPAEVELLIRTISIELGPILVQRLRRVQPEAVPS